MQMNLINGLDRFGNACGVGGKRKGFATEGERKREVFVLDDGRK